MKNIKFILIIAILGVISNMITAKLCEIRIEQMQEEVNDIQYDNQIFIQEVPHYGNECWNPALRLYRHPDPGNPRQGCPAGGNDF